MRYNTKSLVCFDSIVNNDFILVVLVIRAWRCFDVSQWHVGNLSGC